MSINKHLLPTINAQRIKNIRSEISPNALARYQPMALSTPAEPTEINIIGEIGDWWDNITTQWLAKKLAAIGGADLVINLHSDGGDMFEGVAMYNLLKNHKGHVRINIIGMAASAASIIAMAGDEIHVPESGFIMIHNCWVYASGNRHDFIELSQYLEPFDNAMKSVYMARTGMTSAQIAAMMDNETFISGSQAIEMGFADKLLNTDDIIATTPQPKQEIAAHRLNVLLAKSGVSRSERRELIAGIKGTHNAAPPITQNADENEILQEIRAMKADLSAYPTTA